MQQVLADWTGSQVEERGSRPERWGPRRWRSWVTSAGEVGCKVGGRSADRRWQVALDLGMAPGQWEPWKLAGSGRWVGVAAGSPGGGGGRTMPERWD